MRFGSEAQSLEAFHVFLSVEIFSSPTPDVLQQKALTPLQTT
jgi:hypothetical protein